MNDQTFSTYVFAVIIALVFLLIAILISNIIQFQGGSNPKDPAKRRLWFWLLSALCPIVIFFYGYIFVLPQIIVPAMKSSYTTALSISTSIAFVLYVVLGFTLSKIFKHGKISHWF